MARALEHELVSNFNDEMDKPVSAFFTAPIPDHSGAGAATPTFAEATDLKAAALAARTTAELDTLAHTRFLPCGLASGGAQKDASNTELAALMEKMTSDAVDELVEQAFASAAHLDADR